ncbi:hsp70 nucleotide exchange factor fes1 [Vermiconidia calcicola]|uniref:Hsp70 nucleotide exchange factor fes1 n=1 Tax=Vermiconidia calcicola TaxID=1690605 RepID=A0ACC3MGU9_9PEZI|nr:hsp70 nucleotide exchange factor fes1 [Vermiconidia calcicola]
MADQASLNQLLQWGIENSDASRNDSTTQATDQQRDPTRGPNAAALAELLGGPSDADRMREAMSAIVAPIDQVDLENKLIAWDNFEQLIEQIDNANNIESLGMWPPLLQQLDNPEPEMRKMAAWSMSTAVQNNVKCQEKLLGVGAIPKLAQRAVDDENQAVRKKAVNALSSGVRNYQPGMDELEKSLPENIWSRGQGLDAGDMDSVDEVIQKLRDQAAR